MAFKCIWETSSIGSHLLEGPVLSPDGRHVWFTDLYLGQIYKFEIGEATVNPTPVVSFAPFRCNGLQFLPSGKLAICVWKGLLIPRKGAILEFDTASSQTTTRVSSLRAPNDLAVDEFGGVYFSDLKKDRVYYHAPTATSPNAILDLDTPNGIELEFTLGKAMTLFVAESGCSRVHRYEIQGPGNISERPTHTEQFEKDNAVDGLALNSKGHLLVAEETAVYALNAKNLARLGAAPLKQMDAPTPSNICFIDDQTFVVTSYISFVGSKAELFLGKIS